MRNFLSIRDVTDLKSLVAQALRFKKDPYSERYLGQGKTLGLIFMNPSLRTRLSTQRAAYQLGMEVMVMNMNQDSWQLEFQDGTVMNKGTAEHVREAAAVISQYCDIIGIRTFAELQDREKDYQELILSKFVAYAQVPVISLESATLHPLQSLADIVTLTEHQTSKKPKVVVSWAPHPRALPQAVVNSFLQWARLWDCELLLTHPEGYELSDEFTSGVSVLHDQEKALEGADFVYTKNWSSYQQYGQVLKTDASWMINEKKMSLTNNGRFMHCLPLRRNVVATDRVVDNSLVIPQSKNRLYAAQAVLSEILKNG
ncbi:MAG: N-acetylornithine carbamoyltransferase [Cyclobacteriaceae bacterium]|nr:MAG: N-acetylornithine carbamoyltransferase [Cyclobacteriaceae bacterium]